MQCHHNCARPDLRGDSLTTHRPSRAQLSPARPPVCLSSHASRCARTRGGGAAGGKCPKKVLIALEMLFMLARSRASRPPLDDRASERNAAVLMEYVVFMCNRELLLGITIHLHLQSKRERTWQECERTSRSPNTILFCRSLVPPSNPHMATGFSFL